MSRTTWRNVGIIALVALMVAAIPGGSDTAELLLAILSLGFLAALGFLGYPLSTTHTISGAIMGAGAAKRLSAVRWGVAGNIVTAWILTIPAAGSIGALVYGVTRVFGTGALGPVVVSVLVIGLIAAIFGRRWREVTPPLPVGGESAP